MLLTEELTLGEHIENWTVAYFVIIVGEVFVISVKSSAERQAEFVCYLRWEEVAVSVASVRCSLMVKQRHQGIGHHSFTHVYRIQVRVDI